MAISTDNEWIHVDVSVHTEPEKILNLNSPQDVYVQHYSSSSC